MHEEFKMALCLKLVSCTQIYHRKLLSNICMAPLKRNWRAWKDANDVCKYAESFYTLVRSPKNITERSHWISENSEVAWFPKKKRREKMEVRGKIELMTNTKGSINYLFLRILISLIQDERLTLVHSAITDADGGLEKIIVIKFYRLSWDNFRIVVCS